MHSFAVALLETLRSARASPERARVRHHP